MIYQVADIMRDVRVCLDQNMTNDALLQNEDIETLALDDIIKSKVTEAVIRVHCAAPMHLLESGHNFGDSVYWGDQASGWVLLPDDFMRLIVFEMSDWATAVYSAISTSDPKYQLQRQRIKALRGTSQKPVCALVKRQEGPVLEFYSCKTTDAFVSRAQYLPYPKIDENGGIDICERCYTAVIYTVAALVLTTYGEVDKASALTELAKSIIQ